MKALIVEDVPPVAAHLSAELREHCPEIREAGIAHNVLEGLRMIKEDKPDILFLDVDLGGSSGFDLLDLLPLDMQLPVIFTTGSEEHAVRAFSYEAVDYLLKPVEGEKLRTAVMKALKKGNTIGDQVNKLGEREKIALHTQDSIEIVSFEDILHCQSDGNYTIFFLEDGRKLMVSNTLKSYDEMLSHRGFLRVHQSHLVNFSKVRSFIKTEGGFLELNDGSRVPVSYRKKALVMQMLDQYL